MDKSKELIKVIAEKELCGKQFRVWGTPEEPLFLAKDVADWLGYGGGRQAGKDMCRNLNKDEKVKYTAWLPRGTGYQRQVALFVTESGLYTAILESHLPQARPFKKWVTHEVLPCIRKHGYYTKDQARLDKILKMANIIENENYMIEGVK